MVFPKKLRWNLIFLALSGKTIFFFQKIWSYPWTENERWSFSKKYTFWKKKFKSSEKMVVSKSIAPDMIFLVLSGKVVFFTRKHGIFSLVGNRERDDLSQEIHGNMIFSIWYVQRPPAEQKSKTILSHKNTPKGDWHPRSTP